MRALGLASAAIGETSVCARTKEWTNDKIIKFIQAVEARPVLWDTSCNEYKNKNIKHDATTDLGKEFCCDSTEVMRK